MILKKKNPKSSDKNMFNVVEIDGFCCGDKKCALLRKYSLKVDTAVLGAATKISIGGVEYDFGIAVATNSQTGIDMLKSLIHKAINDAGYVANGVEVKLDGTILSIDTYWSQIKFDYLESTTHKFTVADAMPVGDLRHCDCCDAEAVCTVVPPTCFSVENPFGTTANNTVQLLADSGKVLVEWVSDASGDGTEFDVTGVAAIALMASGLEWVYDAADKKLIICEPDCPLDKLIQTDGTTPADIDTFAPHGSVYACFKIVGCKKVTKVTINDGTNDVYSGPLQEPGKCDNLVNVTISGDTVCLDATALGYGATQSFTITIEQEECDDVVVECEVNF